MSSPFWTGAITIERKPTTAVSDQNLSLFVRRAWLVGADLVLLLLNTPSLTPTLDARIARLYELLAPELETDQVVPIPGTQGL